MLAARRPEVITELLLVLPPSVVSEALSLGMLHKLSVMCPEAMVNF